MLMSGIQVAYVETKYKYRFQIPEKLKMPNKNLNHEMPFSSLAALALRLYGRCIVQDRQHVRS